MGLITVSREFGSGGREFGKLLAEELGYDFYDRKIAQEISVRCGVDVQTVEDMLNKGMSYIYDRSHEEDASYSYETTQAQADVQVEVNRFLKKLAEKRKCVIIGRAADVILQNNRPFNIFIYADMEYKIKRCIEHATDGEDISREALIQKILGIDYARAEYYKMYSDIPWGDKSAYHLCINTTDIDLAHFVPFVADAIHRWLEDGVGL